jgi:DNA-binding GntR family transcriptional regulator
LQIAHEIRRRIDAGDLKAGELVPSVRSILRDYGVAMATAQRALAALRSEGYIRVEPGIGSVVTTEEERGRAANDRVEKARRTGKIYPDGQYARILEAVMDEASAQVADALGLKVGQPVIRRARITYRADGQPVSVSTSWFKGSLARRAPRLLVTDRIKAGTFTYVAETLGRSVAAWQDQFEAAIADAGESERLGVDEGSLILRGRNWIYDDSGEVLEYGESVTSGRVTYRSEQDG